MQQLERKITQTKCFKSLIFYYASLSGCCQYNQYDLTSSSATLKHFRRSQTVGPCYDVVSSVVIWLVSILPMRMPHHSMGETFGNFENVSMTRLTPEDCTNNKSLIIELNMFHLTKAALPICLEVFARKKI